MIGFKFRGKDYTILPSAPSRRPSGVSFEQMLAGLRWFVKPWRKDGQD